VLLSEDELARVELARAVAATFTRRRLELPPGTPSGLSDAFAADRNKQAQWQAFLKKNHLRPLRLDEVVALLRSEFEKLKPTKEAT
jgi:hypothetical protein